MSIAKCILVLATSFMCLLPAISHAQTCLDRFKMLLENGNGDDPVKIHVTQEIVGGMKSTNYFYQAKPGHWMSEMIEPATMPWTLTYDNVMYSSADQGKSWTKVREMDSAANAKAAKEQMQANLKTARDAACSEEELDGVMHTTIEGAYTAAGGFKTENQNKYWVNPNTGFIAKAFYHMKADNFESKTTQMIEAAPDLDLPKPQ
nr:hypothetical protein [uncultured Cohaesibacter sp.]